MKKTELKSIIREEVKSLLNEAKYEVTFHANNPQTIKSLGIKDEIPAGTKMNVKGRNTYYALRQALIDLGVPKKTLHPDYPINVVADIIRK